ncbi:MAG: hypothetical protein HYR56_01820 [Acidobacteria bacterium]|nr:hypothetical protein [Acidobacteriota bacterium]MBI3421990.1 hypothetical protein [Acidobacteriota bacterium]
MSQSNKPTSAVVLDDNVMIALCAQEQDKFLCAETAFNNYYVQGWLFYAPGVLQAETLYVLCGKLQSGALTAASHALALNLLQKYLPDISPPPSGDFSLAARRSHPAKLWL